jgi:hypothetical protein
VVGLIDEEMATVGRDALLHGSAALTGNAARGDDDVAAAKNVVNFGKITRDML